MIEKKKQQEEIVQPDLRFKGYTEAWLPQKFSEVSDVVRGASPRPISDAKWFSNNSDVGWLRIADVTEQNGRIHRLTQKLSVLGQQKTRILYDPHLLLSIAATVGKPLINYVKTGVHDGFLIFLNPKFNIDFMFQQLELHKDIWRKYGQPGSQVNLNSNIVKNHKIFIPLLSEQEKISEFFKKIDSLIAKHTQKLELLKKLKKGYLQKIFSQELRFDGFHELWRKQKLKEIISLEFKGKAKANMLGKESRYLETSYLNGGNFSYVSAKADTQKTDILILWDGSQAGTVYYGFSGALGTTLKAFRPKYSGDFLYHFLKQHQQKIYTKYRTPNIPHVIKTFTNDFFVTLPYNDEQERIGYFLNMCDNFISKTVKKIELLDSQKQGYLQKMFI
ncbi:MAG: restriction endonuclease subunit S [Micrococcaceae bacterium]